ncbi:FkbM family methyltransferase [Pelagibius litoralis]|uniref:FkbM family methyltransferase n=1 Tax=Pelagibius litoralis TaxID=374515 RepID=A0A967CBV8_9PROT|nr:FkbM family methyltransferase [Pelagibius litoralis]NIA68519.1 FkbM family methyltransferase [Pelagibius litoralis]
MVQQSVKKLAKAVLPRQVVSRISHHRARQREQSPPRFDAPQNSAAEILGCCIAYTPSGGFCVPLSSRHRPAARRILEGSVYEPETIAFLAANCGSGDIVHAGTYFGDFLPALSRACDPQAKIWAFEPNPESFRCASITCAINSLRNVHLKNSGLGAGEDKAVMQVKDLDGRALGGGSQLLWQTPNLPESLTAEVHIAALDDVIPSNRPVSVIQLDVEGFEQQALSGALETIARCRPILILETVPEETWLSPNILSLGYRIDREIHGNRVLLPPS